MGWRWSNSEVRLERDRLSGCLTSSTGEEDCWRELGWGVALQRKALCLLFTQSSCLDFQKSGPCISRKSPILNSDLEVLWEPRSWPGVIPCPPGRVHSFSIKVPEHRSLYSFAASDVKGTCLENRISVSSHIWGLISALGCRRTGKFHKSLTMAWVLLSPAMEWNLLPGRTHDT